MILAVCDCFHFFGEDGMVSDFMTETSRSWVEISLDAIRHNVRAIRGKLSAQSEILAVVKANAYGHGSPAVPAAIEDMVEYFGVACVSEARALKGLSRDVMLLGPCLPAERKAVVAEDYIVTVSSAAEAAAYAAIGTCRINFKVDTGMGRIGCWHETAMTELELVRGMKGIEVHSLSSHLPSSDEDAGHTEAQLGIFEKFVGRARETFPSSKIHIRNSAGIFGYPITGPEIVRAGLAIYGSAYPSDHSQLLKPALVWKSRVIQIRDVPAGRTISYGRTFVTPHSMRVASISAGYADGYPRFASGRGAHVLIKGQKCAVLGRVTMDQIVVDVSAVAGIAEGEEVVLLGNQGSEEISARELAERAATISWEIFTGISPRVERHYV